MPSSRSNKNIHTSNRPSTSNSSTLPNPNKIPTQRKKVKGSDTLSHNEDVGTLTRHRKITFRALSDYESSEDDVEKAGSSLAVFSRANVREVPDETSRPTQDFCCSKVQSEEACSSDSDKKKTLIRIKCNRGTLRALSDYETGDSIEQAGESTNLSQDNQNLKISVNFSKKNCVSDSSSENESLYKVTRNTFKKRPHNLLSTTDLSDSDTPVQQQRFRKRKRIHSSSEDENVNAVQAQRGGSPNQNCLPRTNRLNQTRPTGPRINIQWSHRATEVRSSSSELESAEEEIRRRLRGMDGYNAADRSNSSQENMVEGSSNGDQLNRRYRSVTTSRSTESIQQNSWPPPTRRQTLRRTRQLRRRNRELEALRTSSSERESETSSDESIGCVRFNGFRGFYSVSQRQNAVGSNDSDAISPRRCQRRTLRILYSDSDSNREQTLPNVTDNSETGNTGVPLNPSNTISSESDVDSEKCPICFSCFGSREVASPESCDHFFCTRCIEEWAKNNNTCPIDRKLFSRIVVSRSFNNNEVLREIPVQAPVQTQEPELRFWDLGDGVSGYVVDPLDLLVLSSSEEEEACRVCNSSGHPHMLIPCDFCSNVYHINCLTPPLRSIPANDWFCPRCIDVELGYTE